MLILERPWTRQPPPNTDLDLRVPLAKRVVAFTNGPSCGVGSKSVAPVLSNQGVGQAGVYASLQIPQYIPRLDAAEPWSLWSFHDGAKLDSTKAAYGGIVGVGAYVTSTNNFETSLSYWNVTTSVMCSFRCDATNPGTVKELFTMPSRPVWLYGQWDWSANNAFWTEETSANYGSGASFGTRSARNTRRVNVTHGYCSFFFDKILTTNEKIWLAQNKWSMFAPHRIYIPTTAAAASAPTITALSARLITATSAQPRISYS